MFPSASLGDSKGSSRKNQRDVICSKDQNFLGGTPRRTSWTPPPSGPVGGGGWGGRRVALCLCPVVFLWIGFQLLLYRFAASTGWQTFSFAGAPKRNTREEDVDVPQPSLALLRGAVPVQSAFDLSVDPDEVPGRLYNFTTSSTTTTPYIPPLPTVVAPAGAPPPYSKDEWFELEWTYLADEKQWPYVGNPKWLKMFEKNKKSRHYLNSLASFPNSNDTRMHGLVGIFSNGSRSWQPAPMPPPADKYPGGKDEALKNGGFYLNLSDALPLDRDPVDGRDTICHTVQYNYSELQDVTVIITFYNEALSTLLRSVHSVLNLTPPPLLRELILVDDHSNSTDNLPGGPLYDYIQLLPKVKLMRLPERRGLVWARLAGAKIAKAPVLVILDSHIEVNKGWLEPQLYRLHQEPKSIVFPQILAVDSVNFDYSNGSGIGCFLSFKWVMQEKSSLTGKIDKPDAIPSPSMAGGLFAVTKDWFWELGGYDEEFSMWGAENVEMGFRTWMCGGRLECTPCARVYHIYRKGGHAYKSPPEALWKNRLRTARVWTDEYFQIAERFTYHPDFDIGPLDKMLELKERLQCKNFTWFLNNVDPTHEIQNMDDILVMGEFRNKKLNHLCLDTLSHNKPGEAWDQFHCHGGGGTQGYLVSKRGGHLRSFTDESKCLGINKRITDCRQKNEDDQFTLPGDGTVRWKAGTSSEQCMAMELPPAKASVIFQPCTGAENQLWNYQIWKPDPNFKLPEYSEEYRRQRAVGV